MAFEKMEDRRLLAATVLNTNFDSGIPSNVVLYGNALFRNTGGVTDLQLTDESPGQTGSAIVNSHGARALAFDYSANVYIGGDSSGAEGLSFGYGDVANAAFGEGGRSSGVWFSIDTFVGSNGSGAIQIIYNGSVVTTHSFSGTSRALLAPDGRRLATMSVSEAGVLTYNHPALGSAQSVTLPSWSPQTNWRFAIGARTGGSQTVSDIHIVDTLVINDTTPNHVPTNIALSNTSIAENSVATVGTLSSTDQDELDRFSYSLVSGTGATDNASFEIVGNQLRTVAGLNFEAGTTRSVRIRSTDQGGLTFEKAFVISVTNVNEAPTDIILSNVIVTEGQPVGTTIGTLTTTDPEPSDTFNYALVPGTGSTDNASFQLVGNSLRTAAVYNFNVKSNYALRLRATDNSGLGFEKAFTILVQPSARLYQSIAPPNSLSSSTGAQFGRSVSISGSYYVAGAPEVTVSSTASVGQAFIFNSTTGALTQTLNNPAVSSTDRMGQSTAITGDIIALGSPGDRVGTTAAGRAMLFNALTGALIATIDNPSPGQSNSFGQSIAAANGLIVVGAPRNDFTTTDSGSIYVYNSSGALQRTINNPSPTVSTLFGTAVDIDNTRIAVGSGSAAGGGRVYIYDVATGSALRTITNPSASSLDKFGDSVAIAGNRIAIGASNAATAFGVRSGRVYIYDLTNGALLQTIDPQAQALGDQFGFALDFDGDNLVIGAPTADPGLANVGIAHVYNANTGGLVGSLINPLPTAEDQFGTSVAISGTKILVGSHLDDTKASNQGYVHVFSLSAPPFTVSLTPTVVPENVPIGTVVGSLSISSANNPPVTFAFIAGAGDTDNARFQIVGSQLLTNTPIDFETKASYTVLVEATNALGIKSQQNYIIAVSNVNENPTALNLSNTRVNEDQPIATLIGTLTTLDPDVTDSFTYSLPVGQADNAKFMLSGTQIRTGQLFDFESQDSYSISVLSQDSGGLTIARSFTITIVDLNPPVITESPRYDARIVADFNSTIQSSNPSDTVELNGVTYFAAGSPAYGRELFRTDRTSLGTSLIKNLVVDAQDAMPQAFTVFNGAVYFLSNYSYTDPLAPPPAPTTTKFGLWKTNGTDASTVLVKELSFSPVVATVRPMNIVNGRLVFNFNGFVDEIWSSDGTEAGTFKLMDAPFSFAPVTTAPTLNTGSLLYLNLAVDTSFGTHSLYRTDGTVAGTFLLRTGESGGPSFDAFDAKLVQMGSNVYFVSGSVANGRELWRTNGTVAGTFMLKDINVALSPSDSSSPLSLTVLNNSLYFTANDGTVGRELWKSDGTPGGTELLKDIRTGSSFDSGFSSFNPDDLSLVAWNGQLYFAADNGSQGLELWKSNGTTVGTQMVLDVGSTTFDGLAPNKFFPLPNRLLFRTSGQSFVQSQLWTTDGTAGGTQLVADPDGSSGLGSFGTSSYINGNRLFFDANNPTLGSELWVSDGTTLGSFLLSDVAPGSASGLQGVLGVGASGIYFIGDDGVVGRELGYSDGTVAGTQLIDVARGTPSSDVREVVSSGSVLYVATSQGIYRVEEGSPAPVRLTTLVGSQLTVVGSTLYFTAPNASSVLELWRSDGTVAGTATVKTFLGATITAPQLLTNANGTLYYTAITSGNNRALWSGNSTTSFPTANGTVERILSVGSSVYIVANNKLYVAANGGYTYLADTLASTLMPWDTTLYFSGFSAASGYELWRTEGTTLSTYLVADIWPGAESSYAGGGAIAGAAAQSTAAGEAIEAKLVFRAIDASGASQLYATNGTTAGTIALTNEPLVTAAGGITASLTPVNLKAVGGQVYFEGYQQDVGRELWVTNGTPNGTKLVKDLRPGAQPDPTTVDPFFISSYFNIAESTAFRNRLFFRTLDTASGRELWTSDGTSAGIAVEGLPGEQSGNARNLTVVNDRLYFAANSFEYGIASFDTHSGELFRLNEAPYALPVEQITAQNTAVNIKLNGIDRDGDTLTYEVISQPLHGTVTINGRIATYTPANGYLKLDKFTYRAFDGSAYSSPAFVTVGVQTSTTRRVSFTSSSTTLTEQNGLYQANIVLTQPATERTQIPYTVGYGGLQTGFSNVMLFLPGQSQATIGIPRVDNVLDQSVDHQIELTLLPNPFVSLGNVPEMLITVADDDPSPEVFFIDYQRTFRETAGTISFEVGLSRPSDRTVTVGISINGAGATPGVDYTAAQTTLVEFLPGQVRRRVSFKLLDDSTPEARELILGGISSVTNATVTADPNRFRSLVWIEDDDISVVDVSPAVTLGVEGDSIVVQATRTGGNLSVPLTIPVTLLSGGSTNSDYSLSSSNFQFAAGASTATITVTLNMDGLVEVFEDVTLELPVSASFNRGANYQSYIGIYDQDRTTISLEFGATNSPGTTAPKSIPEQRISGGNWLIDVVAKLSAPSSQTISVPVMLNSTTLDGYATPGVDFLFSAADFVFLPGQTQVTRTLEIINDSLTEPDERLQIALAPTASQFTLRKNGFKDDTGLSQQLVLRNDDNSYSLTVPERATEGGSFQFTIAWAVPLLSSNRLFVTFNGSLSTSEYSVIGMDNRINNEILFAAGEQSKTFTVNLLDDSLFENPEQVTISVATIFGERVQRTVSVADNDNPPTATFLGPSTVLRVSTESYSVPIVLDRTSTEDIELKVQFGGSAKKDVDFRVEGLGDKGIVRILAGRNIGTLVFNVFDIAGSQYNKTGAMDFDITITSGINASVGTPKPKINVKVVDELKQVCLQLVGKALSAQQTKDILIAHGAIALSTTAAAGQLISSCGVKPNPIDNSSSTINVNGQTAVIAQPFTLQIGNGTNGILEGSQVYFDANFNSVRDYLDTNQNGRQDSGELDEPSVPTNLGGSFAISIPGEFDRNNDGTISTSEGRWVLYGGIDRSTDLPWSLQMSAPIGIFSVTPITTLVDTLMRQQQMSYATAAGRVVSSLDLGSYDLGGGQSIYNVLARDPSASLAYGRQVMLNGLAITAASLISGKSGNPMQLHVDEAFEFLAKTISTPGVKLDLTNSGLVNQLLTSLNNRLSTPLGASTLSGASQLITLAMDRLQALRVNDFADAQDFLRALTRIKKLMYTSVADDLRAVGAGTTTITAVLPNYTNSTAPNFDSRAASQVIGIVIPPVLGVSNAAKIEGQSGSQLMEFRVELLGSHADTVTVNYRSYDTSATAGGDYTSVAGVLTWPAGDNTARIVQVPILGDATFETDETFSLILTDATNAVIQIAQGEGYILNDDAFASSSLAGANNFVVYHGSELTEISQNNETLASGRFVTGFDGSLNGSADSANEFLFDFSSNTYNADHYSIVGGSALDSLNLTAGRFSRVVHRVLTSNTGTVSLTSESNDRIAIDWSSIDTVSLTASNVDQLIIYLPAQVTDAIIEDSDLLQTGQMRVRSASNQFAPILFNVPRNKLSIVRLNSNMTVQTLSTDSSFIGVIEVLNGGVSLSGTSIAENTAAGTIAGAFTTQDPLLVGNYSVSLVAGVGAEGNNAFQIDGNNLKSSSPLDFEAQSSYFIRVRSSDGSSFAVDQLFTINVTNVNEAPSSLTLNNNSVNENSTANALVGLLAAGDPDVGDVLTLSLPVGLGDNSAFNLSGATLRANAPLNFEAKPTYSIIVRVTDAGGLLKDLSTTISVVDLPEMTQPVQIGDGTGQRSIVKQLILNFDAPIVADSGAFLVQQRRNVGGNLVLDTVAVQAAIAPSGQQVTLTFSGSLTNGLGTLVDGNYQITIDGSKLRLQSNNMQFDGNSDGVAGGEYVLGAEGTDKFFAMFGDSDGDRDVDAQDYGRFGLTYRKTSASSLYNDAFDFDTDGDVDSQDYGQFGSRYRKNTTFF